MDRRFIPTLRDLPIQNISGQDVTAGSSKITLGGTPTASAINAFSIDVVEANMALNNIGGTLGLAKGGTNNDLSGMSDGQFVTFDSGQNKLVGTTLEVSRGFIYFLSFQ